MFLISDGTTGQFTTCMVVEDERAVAGAVEALRQRLLHQGGDPDAVTVNPVGPPVSK